MSFLDEQVRDWIDRIHAAYQAEDLVVADSLAQRALAETGQPSKLLEIAGIIAYDRENYDETIRLIESAMLETRLSFASQLVLAKAYLKQGKCELAETSLVFLVEMIEQLPCSMLPDLTLAVAELKRFDLALTVCRTAFARHPDDDNAVFGAAFYMYRLGYPIELVKNLMTKAIALNPGSQLYRVNMAVVCCSLSLWKEAYIQTAHVSDEVLQALPCARMIARLRELFIRFNDRRRLLLLSRK